MNIAMLASAIYLALASGTWMKYDLPFAAVCFVIGLMALTLVFP